jgi:hypothetical protein
MTTRQQLALIILSLTMINLLHSQEIKNLDTSYKEYFSLEREIPYLHLNKTSFIIGEEIWFKPYIYNLNQKKLNNATNNLYVSLYDKKGNLKDKKMIFIENGTGAGSFEVDSTFTEKEYYLKANTTWMKNFNEDASYFQKITIIKEKSKKKNEIVNSYDIQFLPESGHLIESIENTLGVIIKDINNNGVQIKEGKIVDEQKNLVALFKTNSVGLCSIDFIYESDKKYTAEITFLDDTKIEKEIPMSENKGVTLSIYNPNTTFISIIIKTNKSTLPDLLNKTYTLYIHNINKTIKQPFTFNSDAIEYNINLNSRKLDAGVQMVTIFDDQNKPVAERLFFNYNDQMFKKPSISLAKQSADSIALTISKKDTNKEFYYLSASILPSGTQSYNPVGNIASEFLLSPYIKGKIENPNYYFTDINRTKLRSLDLLLLTQGWSKYKWFTIFNNPPKELFTSEKGITISGTVNSDKDSKSIFLMSPDNKLMLSAPIENDKFKFDYLYLKENTEISLSTKQGKKIKQDQFYLKFDPIKTLDKINIDTTFTSFNISEPEINYDNFIRNSNELKGFTIKSKPKTTKRNTTILGTSRSFKIDENSENRLRVLTFIRNRGFLVNENNGNYTIYSGRGAISFQNTRPTKVYLDNNLIQDENGFNNLRQIDLLTLNDFEEIIVSKTGFGTIYLYTKPNFYTSQSINKFSEQEVPFGYSVEKEYYQPLYASYNDDFYKSYGAVNWNPTININDTETEISYNFSNLGQKEVRVFLEGITSEGNIIFEEKLIEIK